MRRFIGTRPAIQDRAARRHSQQPATGRKGMGGRRLLLRGGALFGTLLLVVLALRPAAASHPRLSAVGPALGDLAPALRLPDLQGRRWSLAAWRGHTVALLFLASWCQGCRAEVPGLVHALRTLQAHGLQLVGVDAVGEEPGTVARFARAYGIHFPLLLDTSTAAMTAFAVQALPTTVVIDAAGHILAHYEAPVDASTLLHETAVSR